VVTTASRRWNPQPAIGVIAPLEDQGASAMTTRKRKQERDPERIVLLALTFGLGAAIWLIASGRLQF
jgi:hypothetical protein